MLVIGLTGGIGSGKTAAANYFAELDVPVIDTDELAREVVHPNSDAINKIQEHFGMHVINNDGSLNRKALGEIVFSKPTEREWLEELLHPKIRQLAAERIAALTEPYCILVIPLLVESEPHPLVDRILVIDCPEELQIARVQQRDHSEKAMIQQIIQAQADRQHRLAAADDIIVNDQDLEQLQAQVTSLHQQYLQLTAK